MSWSINIDGGKKADMRNAIRLHIIRQTEEEGKNAVPHLKSDSRIDPDRTDMNVLLLDDEERFNEMRRKLKVIDGNRASAGKRAMRSDCEVFGRGTIQLSDDTLEALGWRFVTEGGELKKLPSSEQSERAIKNVTIVYKRLLESARKQPEIYGDIFTACIHFDEMSPHLDFLTDPLDVDKEQTMRTLKSGKTEEGKLKLSYMQDTLGKYAGFTNQEIEKYDLRRGNVRTEKTDLAVSVRRARRAKKKAVDEKKEVDKKINTAQKRLNDVQRRLNDVDDKLSAETQNLLKTKNMVLEKQKELKGVTNMLSAEQEKLKKLEEQQQKLADAAVELKRYDKRISEKRTILEAERKEAIRQQQKAHEEMNKLEQMKLEISDTLRAMNEQVEVFNNLLEKAQTPMKRVQLNKAMEGKKPLPKATTRNLKELQKELDLSSCLSKLDETKRRADGMSL